MESLKQDMEFIVELDKMKSILRRTRLIHEDRREDDAQHSFHIALMALVLEKYSKYDLDIFKVVKMLLIHDLVEIEAGDTFCYDKKANEDKKSREIKAADKIFSILSGGLGQEFKDLWYEFEEGETKEAKFAIAMDRIQPMLNNFHNQGGTWKEYGVGEEDIQRRISPVKEVSDELWTFIQDIIKKSRELGYIKD